jgi:L,D-transpeptidase catalytic domain
MRLVRVLAVASAAAVFAANAARAEISVIVDKSAQRMTVKRDGVLLYNWPVSTGRRGYATPSGAFTAFRMEADHFSKEWDDAPMPYSIFFTKIGHAIHGTNDAQHLGTPVSHGCVRLSVANAETLYGLVQEDGVLHTKVTLIGSEVAALARPDTGARQNNNPVREQQLPRALDPNVQDNPGYAERYDRSDRQPERRYIDPRAQYPQPNYRQRYDADRDYGPPQYVQPQYAPPPPPRQPLYGYPSYPSGYGGRYD